MKCHHIVLEAVLNCHFRWTTSSPSARQGQRRQRDRYNTEHHRDQGRIKPSGGSMPNL